MTDVRYFLPVAPHFVRGLFSCVLLDDRWAISHISLARFAGPSTRLTGS
jgi:hypothetical protein